MFIFIDEDVLLCNIFFIRLAIIFCLFEVLKGYVGLVLLQRQNEQTCHSKEYPLQEIELN